MNAVVVFESHWGNTAEIARAIAEGIGPEASVLTTDEATDAVLTPASLVVAGAPLIGFSLATDAGRRQIARDPKAPSPATIGQTSMRAWLDALPKGDGYYATFETAFKWSPGSAARKMARAMEAAGYTEILRPERFLVAGSYGPMRPGEVERARAWGAELAGAIAARTPEAVRQG